MPFSGVSAALLKYFDSERPDTQKLVDTLAEGFTGSSVSLFWSLHGVLYLSATTDPELRAKAEREDVCNEPGDGLTGQVMATGRALRFVNANDPLEVGPVAPDRAGPLHPEATGLDGRVQRSLLVPVRHTEQTRGVLRLSRNAPHEPYSASDERVLQRFADLLGRVMGDFWELQVLRTIWRAPSFSAMVSHEGEGPKGASRIVAVSPGAHALIGYTEEQLGGSPPSRLYADRDAARQTIGLARASGAPVRLVARREDQRLLPVTIHYQDVVNSLVVPPQRHTIGIAYDDTARTQAEAVNERFEEVLDELDMVYFRWEVSGRALHPSRTERRLTGFRPEELRDVTRLWPSRQAREALVRALRAAPDRKVRDQVVQLRHKDGHPLIVSADVRLVVDPETGREVLEGVYRDISDRIALQRSLDAPTDRQLPDAELHERLLHHQEAQNAFVASVGHQLKAPLANVLDGLRNAQEGRIPGEFLMERLGRLAAQVQRCLDIVLGLSMLHQVLRGSPARRRSVTLARLCRQLADDFNPTLRNARLRLDVEVGPQVVVQADPDLLRQILYNLLDNAVKYSDTGTTIRVRANVTPPWVDVMNRGLPIEGSERERVFERGYRLVQARAVQAQGTGLGLWLARELCRAMGASVSFLEEWEGSDRWNVFRVTFERR